MSGKTLMERARAVKNATLREVERSDYSSLYVVNNMAQRGHINFSVVSATGRVQNVRVPFCGIPVDLSEQATKANILDSPDFRQLVAKKAILLKNEEESESFFEAADAKAERARVNKINEVVEVASPSDVDSELGVAKAESEGDISAFVLQLSVSGNSEEEMLADLRAREQDLSVADFSYLAMNSDHDKVKQWSAERAVKK